MSSKYLANGTIIGNHYEIIDILGEDDFEILYLVKNIHRRGSFFVIKELFLEVFSTRKDTRVETIPEALGVFNKRKSEIISEIDRIHRKHIENEIKVFAYFEENDTIYSCMAYTPNAKVEEYLQFEPKSDTKLPLLEELTQTEEEKKKTSPLLWAGVSLLTLVGGVILAFNQFNKKDSVVNVTKEKNDTIIQKDPSEDYKVVFPLKKNIKIEEKKELLENNVSLRSVSKKEINVTSRENLELEKNITKQDTLSQSEKKREDAPLSKIFSKTKVRQFLNKYLRTTAHSSSWTIIKLYDNRISRYFQFRNITPRKVRKSVLAYNRKWKHRKFKLVNFKILKRYTKKGINYCDIKTHTKWYVSNRHGKKKSGHSKGFMTIKDTKKGFKVKAIYGVR